MNVLAEFRLFLAESNYRLVPVSRPTNALIFKGDIAAFQKLLVENNPEVVFVTECVGEQLFQDCGVTVDAHRRKSVFERLANIKGHMQIENALNRGLALGELVVTVPIGGQLVSLNITEPWYQEARLAVFQAINAI
ncbi:hypothetical protein ACSK1O_004595 [Escherichia coli]|nr:hypothetical protein [Salmonella enterica]